MPDSQSDRILKVPASRVVPSARLVEDLDVDSLFITQLAMGLENEFSIEVDDANLPGLTTVQSVVDFVMAKKGENQGGRAPRCRDRNGAGFAAGSRTRTGLEAHFERRIGHPEHFQIRCVAAWQHVEPRDAALMHPFIAYAAAAARAAIDDSGVLDSDLCRRRIGVSIGSAMGGMNLILKQNTVLHTQSPRRISPLFIPFILPDAASGYVSIQHKLQGPNHITVSASFRRPSTSTIPTPNAIWIMCPTSRENRKRSSRFPIRSALADTTPRSFSNAMIQTICPDFPGQSRELRSRLPSRARDLSDTILAVHLRHRFERVFEKSRSAWGSGLEEDGSPAATELQRDCRPLPIGFDHTKATFQTTYFWLVALLVVAGVAPALAQLPPGLPVAPENFAAPHFFGSPSAIGIRHLSLGGAYVADDRSGWHGNPAGLVALRRPTTLSSHNDAGFDALPTFCTNFLGYAQPFGKNGENVLKISGITVRADGVATGGAAPIGLKSGEDDIAIEFARRVNPRLSVGIGTAYLRTETTYSVAGIGAVTALRSRPSTLGGRVGLVYDATSQLSFGATYDHYIERVERSVPVLSAPIESFRFRSEGYRIGTAHRPDSNTTLLADYEDLKLTGNETQIVGRSLLHEVRAWSVLS